MSTVEQLARAQKPSRGVSLYSRFVNRPAGRVLAALASVAGLSANQVTLISAVVTGIGIALIATVAPSVPMALAVALTLVLGFALDAADGQLARLQGGGTPAGEWLDHVVDSAKMVAIHAAVLVSFYRFGDVEVQWLLIPLGFQVVAVVAFSGGLISELLSRGQAAPPARVSTLRAAILLPADYGVLCLTFVLLAWPEVFVVAYTALFAVQAVLVIPMCVRWFRRLASLATG